MYIYMYEVTSGMKLWTWTKCTKSMTIHRLHPDKVFFVIYSCTFEANATFLIHQWSVFAVHFPFLAFLTPHPVVPSLSQPVAGTEICGNQYHMYAYAQII